MKLTSLVLSLAAMAMIVAAQAEDLQDMELEDLLEDDELDLDLYDEGDDDLFGQEVGISVVGSLVGGLNNQLPLEADAAVLCGVVNHDSQAVNVSGLVGTMHNPADYSQVLMNLTALPVFDTLAGGAEATYAYRFKLPKSVGAQSFTITMALVYMDLTGQQQGRAFFNETVEFVAPVDDFDNLGFLMKAAVFVALVAAAYIGVQSMLVGKGGSGSNVAGSPLAGEAEPAKPAADFGDSIKPVSGAVKRRHG